ncbi:hypothetical protein HELRODRAFT_177596 [Helobdella robusta]|uniref:Uncharacterized protein n=1 Tax=Helobdella robusta TaxID=6412 RepID=T1FBX2_HELRO|nr:hypothetical protein HELRODRAFT_177596 [Helobdella robusta]ESN97933.1 hypothetical protein HELRODRAFT_177596 [Helobdella robusta]
MKECEKLTLDINAQLHSSKYILRSQLPRRTTSWKAIHTSHLRNTYSMEDRRKQRTPYPSQLSTYHRSTLSLTSITQCEYERHLSITHKTFYNFNKSLIRTNSFRVYGVPGTKSSPFNARKMKMPDMQGGCGGGAGRKSNSRILRCCQLYRGVVLKLTFLSHGK